MPDIYDIIPTIWCAACRRHVDMIAVDPSNPTSLKAYCHGKTETQPLDMSDPKPMTFFLADGEAKKLIQVAASNAAKARDHARRGKSLRSAKRNGWRHTPKTP